MNVFSFPVSAEKVKELLPAGVYGEEIDEAGFLGYSGGVSGFSPANHYPLVGVMVSLSRLSLSI